MVRLAALDAEARNTVLARFASVARTRAFALADAALAATIERSGRADAQNALAGPLLQIVGPREVPGAEHPSGDSAEDAPDVNAFAEPALAALLALLVRDLLSTAHFATLYGPFDTAIPAEPLPAR